MSTPSMPSHIPQGNYPAHAAAHLLDLEQAADRLLAQLPGNRRQAETLARESGSSVVLMALEAGDAIQEHSAGGPVSVHVLRGHVQLTAGEEKYDLRPGQLVFMQPNVRHGVAAAEQSVVLLTLSGTA